MAFDRVWHAVFSATMSCTTSVETLSSFLKIAMTRPSAWLAQWQKRRTVQNNNCLLSTTFFNIFLERVMADALGDHKAPISIVGKTISYLLFAGDIDNLAGTEIELANMLECLARHTVCRSM